MWKCILIIVRTVNGNWGAWTQWSTCSLSCGGGSRKRSRRCDNPPPNSGGTHCPGDDHQIDYCNKEECPGKCLLGKMKNGFQRFCRDLLLLPLRMSNFRFCDKIDLLFILCKNCRVMPQNIFLLPWIIAICKKWDTLTFSLSILTQ